MRTAQVGSPWLPPLLQGLDPGAGMLHKPQGGGALFLFAGPHLSAIHVVRFAVPLTAVPLGSLFKSGSCKTAVSTYCLVNKVFQETQHHPVMGGWWGRESALCLQDILRTT